MQKLRVTHLQGNGFGACVPFCSSPVPEIVAGCFCWYETENYYTSSRQPTFIIQQLLNYL